MEDAATAPNAAIIENIAIVVIIFVIFLY